MRPSKYDKYVCVACLIIFLYSFFIIGGRPIYESERIEMIPPWERSFFLNKVEGVDRVASIEYPTSVYIAPLVCIVFFCFWVFEEPLRVVDRHWVKKKIRKMLNCYTK